jgi:2-dehydro-3-deoxyphosphogluconate aldolase / (4S)-4-hydroxy-2-oxoglutarate aldolase
LHQKKIIMKKTTILAQVLEEKSVAVIRLNDPKPVIPVVKAVASGGVRIIEITLTTPDAFKLIERLSDEKGILVGAGTVLDKRTAKQAIDAGARFIVSPVLNTALIETAHKHHVVSMIGAMTPTEIYTAYKAGADIVKVFPAEVVGTAFFKSVKAPLPSIQMMPTGGVTLTNAGDWLAAGACAVGIGGALLDAAAIATGDMNRLTENARVFRQSIAAFLSKSQAVAGKSVVPKKKHNDA